MKKDQAHPFDETIFTQGLQAGMMDPEGIMNTMIIDQMIRFVQNTNNNEGGETARTPLLRMTKRDMMVA